MVVPQSSGYYRYILPVLALPGFAISLVLFIAAFLRIPLAMSSQAHLVLVIGAYTIYCATTLIQSYTSLFHHTKREEEKVGRARNLVPFLLPAVLFFLNALFAQYQIHGGVIGLLYGRIVLNHNVLLHLLSVREAAQLDFTMKWLQAEFLMGLYLTPLLLLQQDMRTPSTADKDNDGLTCRRDELKLLMNSFWYVVLLCVIPTVAVQHDARLAPHSQPQYVYLFAVLAFLCIVWYTLSSVIELSLRDDHLYLRSYLKVTAIPISTITKITSTSTSISFHHHGKVKTVSRDFIGADELFSYIKTHHREIVFTL